jgi:hypothetical protein
MDVVQMLLKIVLILDGVLPETAMPNIAFAVLSSRSADTQGQPTALSQLNFGVHRLEFAAGVVDLHLPIDAALGAVHIG